MAFVRSMFKPATVLCAALITGCGAPLATIPARQQETTRLTLGAVQAHVKAGAASADVIAALGSPNIITSNKDGTETWVYDKVSTESETADGSRSSVTVKSTRTMLVTVKFDKQGVVENAQYRQTSY